MAELERRLRQERDPKVRQDIDILIDSARDKLSSRALERKYFLPFVDVTQLIYGVAR